MTKIAVFGAGRIGSYIGGMLQASGIDVTFMGRDGPVEALRRSGLHLTDYLGGDLLVPPDRICATTDPSTIGSADIILLTVKSAATEGAAEEISRRARQGTTIVSLQNGVANAAILRRLLPQHEVVAGMVAFNVASSSPGHFHRGTGGTITIGHGKGVDLLIAVLHRAGLEAAASHDMEAVAWGKLILNLNNAINALSGLPLREELSDRRYRRVLALAMEEALRVLKAAGIRPARIGRLPPHWLPRILALPDGAYGVIASIGAPKMDGRAGSSMSDDIRAGRLTEVREINGAVVDRGSSHEIATPVNAALVDLVEAFVRPISSHRLLHIIEIAIADSPG